MPRTIAAPSAELPFKALFERHFVLVASLLLNLVFAAGLYFAWSAVTELARVREELSTFENVETRIAKRLEVFNTGLQNRLAATDMQYQQINDGVREIRMLVDELKADAQSDRQSRQLMAREVAAPPVEMAPEPVVIEAPATARAPAKVAREASAPQFKRVLQGNGKVTYQRVN